MSSFHPFVNPDEKAVDGKLLRRLWRRARPYRGQLLLATILLLLITLGEQAKPLLIKLIIDNHIARGDMQGVWSLAALFLLSVIWVFTLQAWQTVQTRCMGQRLQMDLRGEIFAKIHSQSLRWFDQNPVGGLMTRVIYDAEALNQLFISGVSAVFQDFFTLLVAAGTMLAMDIRLGVVSLLLLPVLAWSTAIFRKKARENFRAQRANTARLNAFLSESLSGMSTLQLCNAEAAQEKSFEVHNGAGLRLLLAQVRIHGLFIPISGLLSALAVSLALVYGGARYLEGSLPIGVLVASLMYIQRFFEPLRDLAEKFGILQSAMASSERIFELLDRQEEVENPTGLSTAGGLPPTAIELEFCNVWFSYAQQGPPWALKDVSFSIRPGQHAAIVGPTGAGKTSLVNVLYRFYPFQRGSVRLNSRDIREIPLQDLRRHMALVPQDPFLFSGSILENLRLSDPSIPAEKVQWACRQVQAHAFILSLPGGYSYELLEGGANLSTGQKQLLAFARALCFDPGLLVLDEATSSVDIATDEQIQLALENLLRGRTSLTIAHRLSTILQADCILVVHNGEIVEQGRHAELQRRNGLYRALCDLQFRELA